MQLEFDNMLRFNKNLYSKTALLKASYNFTDRAYVHLDADDNNYYVSISPKKDNEAISEEEFVNEMLAQSVRHEIYSQTKNIRELMFARAMASSVMIEEKFEDTEEEKEFAEDEILKDWFAE